MSLQRNHYEVLGVPQNATTDQIKKKYRELARKFHPDVVEDKALGQRVFSQINQAYRALGDPERRAHYDATLVAEAARPAPGSAVRPSGTAAPPRSAETVAAAAVSLADVPRLMAEADRAVMAGKMTDARLICERVVKADPRNAKAWEILGDALAQTGNGAEAANAYRSSLQIAPSMMVQAKLNRLQAAPAANGARPGAPAANGTPRPAAPANGARTSPSLAGAGAGAGVNRTQPTTDAKPAGGLLGRLLGRK